MYKVQLITLALLLLFSTKLAPADPIPGPILDVWDNINGTAGEALTPLDIYLTDERKARIMIQLDPLTTSDYYDSSGSEIRDSVFDYYRINIPISVEYGIPGLFEIGFRFPYLAIDRQTSYRSIFSSNGRGDFSIRIRKRVYGGKDDKVYLALGGGIKFPNGIESYYYSGSQLSYGSLDIFFGAYSMIRTGSVKYPIQFTYSHTGRGWEDDRVGDIITYRLGFLTDFGNFVDLSLGLKGYEIFDEHTPIINNIFFGTDYPAQGISKTSLEANLIITTLENRVNFSAGIVYDLRGKRSYAGTSPIFAVQVNF
jgi:hypothetical protein